MFKKCNKPRSNTTRWEETIGVPNVNLVRDSVKPDFLFNQNDLNLTGCNFAEKNIELEASHSKEGKLFKYKTQPRGTYSVDLPTTTGDNIVEITVYAEDPAGNKRQLTIPVSIVESSLETRVIQHSEQKD